MHSVLMYFSDILIGHLWILEESMSGCEHPHCAPAAALFESRWSHLCSKRQCRHRFDVSCHQPSAAHSFFVLFGVALVYSRPLCTAETLSSIAPTPELLLEEVHEISRPAEMYSFGVIVWECLTERSLTKENRGALFCCSIQEQAFACGSTQT